MERDKERIINMRNVYIYIYKKEIKREQKTEFVNSYLLTAICICSLARCARLVSVIVSEIRFKNCRKSI